MLSRCKESIPTSKKSGIYTISNIRNGKRYVGSAVVMCRRTKSHYDELIGNRHRNKHLQAAWNKYGEGAFRFTTLEIFDKQPTKEELLGREQHWINLLNTYNKGYNLSPTAGSNQGYKHSEESRKKNSERQKGKSTAHMTAASVLTNKGRKRTQEEKDKISAAKKGKKLSEEHKAAIKANHWSVKGTHPFYNKLIVKEVDKIPELKIKINKIEDFDTEIFDRPISKTICKGNGDRRKGLRLIVLEVDEIPDALVTYLDENGIMVYPQPNID